MSEDEQTNNIDSAPDRSNERSSTRRTPRVGRTSDTVSARQAISASSEVQPPESPAYEEGGPRPA